MSMNIRCCSNHRLRLRNIISSSVHIGHARTRFLRDECPRGHIPWIERHLPKTVKAAGCHVTKIKRCRAKPAHSLREFAKLHKVSKVILRRVPRVVWESSHEQAPLQFSGRGYTQRSSIKIGSFAAFSKEHFVAHRIVNGTQRQV